MVLLSIRATVPKRSRRVVIYDASGSDGGVSLGSETTDDRHWPTRCVPASFPLTATSTMHGDILGTVVNVENVASSSGVNKRKGADLLRSLKTTRVRELSRSSRLNDERS